jgi:adenine-specific DNA-methyltransferase
MMKKLTVKDAETMSANVIADNVARLNALFPELIAEGKQGVSVNVDVLKALVGDKLVTDSDEKYGLNWHGKRQARQLALTPSTGTLRPCPDDSVNWDKTQNLMIEGDNLEVLKLLQKSYAGKIKVVYIDPPYNTGKDFVYPDSFQDNIKNYLELTGQLSSGVTTTSNPETSGRFHTVWLNMMYSRIKLARNLLRDDGTIVISADDNETHNLRRVCDEIFGEDNFIGQFVVNSSPSAIDYGHIAKMHDYALMYAKDLAETTSSPLEEEEKVFKYEDEIGPFNIYPLYNGNVAFNPRTRPNLFYPFYLNTTARIGNDFYEIGLEKKKGWVEVFPVVSRKDGIQRVWRWGKEKALGGLNKEIVGYRNEDGDFRVVQKTRHTGKVIRSLQLDKEISTRRGTAEVESLLGGKVFPFPKPVELIRRFLAVGTDHDSIILDFFAGSGTTAQAVMALNASDEGKRRCILVQFPEQLSPNDGEQKVAADFCDKIGKPRTIAEITKERWRRAGKRARDEKPLFPNDIGFRVFKLSSSNIQSWEPSPETLPESLDASVNHLKQDRTEKDILYELLLKLGLDLCVPMDEKTIAGKTVQSVGAGTLIVCLAPKISRKDAEPLALGIVKWHKEMAPAGESTVVFRDSAFADDVAKTNVAAILEQHGLTNVRSL